MLFIITILCYTKICDYKTIKILNSEISRLNKENTQINQELILIREDNKDNLSDISDLKDTIKALNETIDEISKLKKLKPVQDTFPIDIRLSKCIKYSKSFGQDYNCQYSATEDWKKEMNKSLLSLKKKMKVEDYKIRLSSQKKWEISKNNTIELMDKYITQHGGIFQQTIVESETSNIYKNRALILNSLNSFIDDYYYAEKFKE